MSALRVVGTAPRASFDRTRDSQGGAGGGSGFLCCRHDVRLLHKKDDDELAVLALRPANEYRALAGEGGLGLDD